MDANANANANANVNAKANVNVNVNRVNTVVDMSTNVTGGGNHPPFPPLPPPLPSPPMTSGRSAIARRQHADNRLDSYINSAASISSSTPSSSSSSSSSSLHDYSHKYNHKYIRGGASTSASGTNPHFGVNPPLPPLPPPPFLPALVSEPGTEYASGVKEKTQVRKQNKTMNPNPPPGVPYTSTPTPTSASASTPESAPESASTPPYAYLHNQARHPDYRNDEENGSRAGGSGSGRSSVDDGRHVDVDSVRGFAAFEVADADASASAGASASGHGHGRGDGNEDGNGNGDGVGIEIGIGIGNGKKGGTKNGSGNGAHSKKTRSSLHINTATAESPPLRSEADGPQVQTDPARVKVQVQVQAQTIRRANAGARMGVGDGSAKGVAFFPAADNGGGNSNAGRNGGDSNNNSSDNNGDNNEKSPSRSWFTRRGKRTPSWPRALGSGCFAWVMNTWTWSNVKPVLRCSLAAWISAVLFAIPRVELVMGQASFLILIAAVLSPPLDPFIAVLERETLILLLSCLSWGWSCIGIRLSQAARNHFHPDATLSVILTGAYIEAAPTVILGVFIFLGSSFLLFVKAKRGPGPYLFATVLSCICLDISITTAVLFPFPVYSIGKSIILPLALHSAIALFCSITVFPSTVSAQFTTRLQNVLSPLEASLAEHIRLLNTQTEDPAFASLAAGITAHVDRCEANLAPLAAAMRLLHSDLIFCRFSPADFADFQKLARRISGRANGMGMYFALIDPTRERFPGSASASASVSVSVVPTPVGGRSRAGSVVDLQEWEGGRELKRERERDGESLDSPVPPRLGHHRIASHPPQTPPKQVSGRTGSRFSHFNVSWLQHALHSHSLGLGGTPSRGGGGGGGATGGGGGGGGGYKPEYAVGVFESHKYLNLEAKRYGHPDSSVHTNLTNLLLRDSCEGLIHACREGVVEMGRWLGSVRKDRFNFWVAREVKRARQAETLRRIEETREMLGRVLEEFRVTHRHVIVEPYLAAFEEKAEYQHGYSHTHSRTHSQGQSHTGPPPPHHHLFHCYVYQYHLMQFADIVLEMLDEAIRLERERPVARLWTPVRRIFKWDSWEIADNVEHDDDEDPEVIQGVEPTVFEDLGIARRRDPDALPPRNKLEWVMNQIYRGVASLAGGNVQFAIKAGVLTVLMCLPSFLKSSAEFAYRHRFVWGVFMGQFTLARFRGDTAFGLAARVLSTFLGGLVGAVMWYISCGNAKGNAFGLVAVCFVCFPFFFYARLYFPGHPMTTIVFLVTAILVLGYSYIDVQTNAPGSPGFGISLAWRRFVLVTVGVVAAFIFSFLPPSTTIRLHQRKILSTASSEIGGIYCAICSYATTKREGEVQEIISSLLAIRAKLKRSAIMRTNVAYEFSLRGRWPIKRYQKIEQLQLQITYCLTHLLSILTHLEPSWTLAFLRRTRFNDPDFQGDVLAVINMVSSSLSTGNPLPQITPCPLLDRFMLRFHGLDVIHKESEEDYGLPRTLTADTLKNEQYLMFCVGVSSAFALMTRLDKLMVAAKEIVGEQYHIHGIGVRGERGYYGRSSHPSGASGGASGYGYGYGYGYGPNSQHGKGGSSVDMGRPHKDA